MYPQWPIWEVPSWAECFGGSPERNESIGIQYPSGIPLPHSKIGDPPALLGRLSKFGLDSGRLWRRAARVCGSRARRACLSRLGIVGVGWFFWRGKLPLAR